MTLKCKALENIARDLGKVAVAVAVAILYSCSRFLRIRLSRILEQASPDFTWDKFCSRCL